MQIRHILLPTDLSPESLHPCLSVVSLAEVFGARITLLHVVLEPLLVGIAVPLGPMVPADVGAELLAAERELAEQRKRLGDGVEAAAVVVRHERVQDAVVDYARAHGVDLIALSTHGRTGLRHLALGSVAESILRHSPVPVLIFPRGA